MTKSHPWLFRMAFLLTGLWLLAAIYVVGAVYKGWSFPLDLRGVIGKPTETLSLNELGDFLAGVSAPLAFGWFFVSTLLQRYELDETRKELAKQVEHQGIAAEESTRQTKIMLAREVFEEHNLRLYYLAVYLLKTTIVLKMRTPKHMKTDIPDEWGYTNIIELAQVKDLAPDNNRSVDHVLIDFTQAVRNFIATGTPYYRDASPKDSSEATLVLGYIRGELRELIHRDEYQSNNLVQARLNGIDLESTLMQTEKMIKRLEPFVPPPTGSQATRH